jgi:hypothetical protein
MPTSLHILYNLLQNRAYIMAKPQDSIRYDHEFMAQIHGIKGNREMIKKNMTQQHIPWLLVGMMSILLGLGQLMMVQENSASDINEGNMDTAHTGATKSVKMPPLDAAAPEIYETASFGLG